MDKKRIETMCGQILQAINTVEIRGEQNMMQMLGVARNVRNILIELGKPEEVDADE